MTIKYFDKAISPNKIPHKFGFIWKDIDQILDKIHSEKLLSKVWEEAKIRTGAAGED